MRPIALIILLLGSALSLRAQAPAAPTVTPDAPPWQTITGSAYYQNRADHAGIQIAIIGSDGRVLATSQTGPAGHYQAQVPDDAPFVIEADAPLHLPAAARIQPGDAIPPLLLDGGDLNEDGCIGQTDINLLLAAYEASAPVASDINGDGRTSVADFAILTGNVNPHCEAAAAAAAAISPTPEHETTPYVEVTGEISITPIAPELPEAEATQDMAPTPEIDIMPEVEQTPPLAPPPEATLIITLPPVETTPTVAPPTTTPTPEATAPLWPTAETTPTVAPPTTTPTPSATATPTATASPTPTPTSTATATISAEQTAAAPLSIGTQLPITQQPVLTVESAHED